MAETITLPKSGIVLERSAEKGTHWRRYIGPFCVEVRDHGEQPVHPTSYPRWAYSTGGGWSFTNDPAYVVKSLDESMLKALAALLPADARERVARWVRAHDYRGAELCDDPDCGGCVSARLDADAVLAALRERLAAAEALVVELAAVAKAAKAWRDGPAYAESMDPEEYALQEAITRAVDRMSPAARKEIEG